MKLEALEPCEGRAGELDPVLLKHLVLSHPFAQVWVGDCCSLKFLGTQCVLTRDPLL